MAKPGPKPRPLAERFWAKVDKKGSDECWEWTAHRDKKGYGKINAGGQRDRTFYAHRVSYELANGPILKGKFVCHYCDNPGCVNPRHLFSGTQKENIEDAIRKSRFPHGENTGSSKLTDQDVHEIRQMLSRDISQRVIAKKYEVNHSTISDIKTGKSWAWLKEV